MNEYYERIKALFKTANINVPEGAASDGEAYAYGAALAAAAALPSLAAARTGMDGEAATDYAYYASLLDIDSSRFSPEALPNVVKERLYHSFADYTADDVALAFQRVGSGGMYTENGVLTFIGIHAEDLAELGKFIAGFQYCGIPVGYSGNGMTFDEWEALDYSFERYDRLQLPWSILDYYRRNL